QTITLAALILGVWIAALSAQTRYGASIYVQTSAPANASQLGSLWWDTQNNALNVLTALPSTWTALSTSSGTGVPSGLIAFLASGTCPTGWTEVSGLSGRIIRGTVAANGNVGTTGGSDTYTPQGSVAAPTFTGTPFTSVINHTHPATLTVQG